MNANILIKFSFHSNLVFVSAHLKLFKSVFYQKISKIIVNYTIYCLFNGLITEVPHIECYVEEVKPDLVRQ